MHWSLVWLGYLLTWATIPHILLRNKPPASTLAWVWAVILFPYLGPFFYFLFGTDRLIRQRLRATRAMDATGAREERKITAHTEALVEQLPPADHRSSLPAQRIRRFRRRRNAAPDRWRSIFPSPG
ncbi:MAG TPA: PLDc N-terminal domain-containing protein [Chthoniobacterales bacterium]